MTMTDFVTSGTGRMSRWLLLGSLALNLFFIGLGGAIILHSQLSVPPAPAVPADRSASARIERLAATLPAGDAKILREKFFSQRDVIESARSSYLRARDGIRGILRAEPFNAEAMRAAMTDMRGARQAFDQLLQAMIASAAADMSSAGRRKLADWPPASRVNTEAGR